MQHLGARGWSEQSLRYRTLLWVMPVLTLLLVWTSEGHRLIWRQGEPAAGR